MNTETPYLNNQMHFRMQPRTCRKGQMKDKERQVSDG